MALSTSRVPSLLSSPVLPALLFIPPPALFGRSRAPRHTTQLTAADDTRQLAWAGMLAELREYKACYGTATATAETALGRWCGAQRRAREAGTLAPAREAALEDIGFSWRGAAVDLDDEWDELLRRLGAYRAEHGDLQVPKKYRRDPRLGAFVALVRRTGLQLSARRRAELDAAGFEWNSNQKCGSAFMLGLGSLRAFQQVHGHASPSGADGDELVRWCSAQRAAARKGLLSEERRGFLAGLGFEFD